SLAQQTSSLVGALNASVKHIVSAVQAVPANRVESKAVQTHLRSEILGASESGCIATDYGQVSGLRGSSSLPSGWRWLRGGDFAVGGASPTSAPITSEQGAATITTGLEDKSYNSAGATFREMRESAGRDDADASELLNPA